MHTDSPVTVCLMTLIFFGSVTGFIYKKFFLAMVLHPYSVVKNGEYWRLLTSDFVHNDLIHLAVNEFMLYISCSNLEYYLGTKSKYSFYEFLFIYLSSYFTGVIVSTIRHRNDFNFSTAGASGSIMGCLFSFILLKPDYVAFYAPAFGAVKNVYGGLLYILVMILYLRRKEYSMANHELHFFSGLGGIAATLVLFPGSL